MKKELEKLINQYDSALEFLPKKKHLSDVSSQEYEIKNQFIDRVKEIVKQEKKEVHRDGGVCLNDFKSCGREYFITRENNTYKLSECSNCRKISIEQENKQKINTLRFDFNDGNLTINEFLGIMPFSVDKYYVLQKMYSDCKIKTIGELKKYFL